MVLRIGGDFAMEVVLVERRAFALLRVDAVLAPRLTPHDHVVKSTASW